MAPWSLQRHFGQFICNAVNGVELKTVIVSKVSNRFWNWLNFLMKQTRKTRSPFSELLQLERRNANWWTWSTRRLLNLTIDFICCKSYRCLEWLLLAKNERVSQPWTWTVKFNLDSGPSPNGEKEKFSEKRKLIMSNHQSTTTSRMLYEVPRTSHTRTHNLFLADALPFNADGLPSSQRRVCVYVYDDDDECLEISIYCSMTISLATNEVN